MTLACDLNAISPDARPRHSALTTQLRAAMRNRADLLGGYKFKIDSEAITLPEIAEWIALERLCCPFLTFQLDVRGADVRLTLSGPEGAKAILQREFPG
jgi:hypothetical protein